MNKDTKKDKNKKPKFNMYWIYGGVIVLFIAMQVLGGSGFDEIIAEYELKEVTLLY